MVVPGNNRQKTQLIALLDEAVAVSSRYSGGYSNKFLSAEEFHKALELAVSELKLGKMHVLNDLWGYFAPTCAWDDFVGRHEGSNLAKEIFGLINQLRS